MTSARAMATRCCWPPESVVVLRRSKPFRPTSSSISITARRTSFSSTFFQAKAEGDVLEHVQVREQRVFLEHRVDRPFVRRQARDVPARKKDIARSRLHEPSDDAERGGLAAAGRAEEGDELFVVDIEVEAVQNAVSVEIDYNVLAVKRFSCSPLQTASPFAEFTEGLPAPAAQRPCYYRPAKVCYTAPSEGRLQRHIKTPNFAAGRAQG